MSLDDVSNEEVQFCESVSSIGDEERDLDKDAAMPYEYHQNEPRRKIVLYFTKDEFVEYQAKFKYLKSSYQVTTETEVVKKLIEHIESCV